MSLYAMLKSKGASGFGYSSTAEDVTAGLALQGKTIFVTGCNSGLGYETMRVLALRGAHVIGAARSQQKAQEACASIKGKATATACELADPASIRACVETIKSLKTPLDAVICNAGIMALPQLQQAFGYELQFFTNHIGHFILVTGLLDHLASNGRVVMLSSLAHRSAPACGIEFDNLSGAKHYSPARAYGQSKLANLLFAKELSRRFAGTAKTANAVHPGVIATNLFRYMNVPELAVKASALLFNLLFFKTIPQGAATQCYAAVNPAFNGKTGHYLADSNIARPGRLVEDAQLALRLWETSESIAASLPKA